MGNKTQRVTKTKEWEAVLAPANYDSMQGLREAHERGEETGQRSMVKNRYRRGKKSAAGKEGHRARGRETQWQRASEIGRLSKPCSALRWLHRPYNTLSEAEEDKPSNPGVVTLCKSP